MVRARGATWLAALALAGCVGGEVDEPAGPSGPAATDTRTRAYVVTTLGFTRQTKPGVREGFDLDGRVSDKTDEATCFKADAVDPDGRGGIDNELSGIIPTVDGVFQGAVDGLVQSSIRDGQLVLSYELRGVDDLANDPEVDFVFQVGLKAHPSLGTDGVIEAYQTFDPDPASPPNTTNKAHIKDGVLYVGPLSLALPIAIFDVSFVLHLQDAQFRATIADDGSVDGLIGGGIVIQELLDGVKQGAGVEQNLPMIRLAMSASADLAPDADGVCRQLSAALSFRSKPAFVRW